MITILFFGTLSLSAQTVELINLEKSLVLSYDKMTNGYAKKIVGENLTYSNMWNDCEHAFLSRATNGIKVIEWVSEPVEVVNDGYAELLMVVCVDQAVAPANFNFSVNDKYVGNLQNFHEDKCFVELSDGITVDFKMISASSWGDGSFFMIVKVPESMVKVGEPVKFKIVGEKAESNAWFMIFKSEKLKQEIVHRANSDEYYEVINNKNEGTVEIYTSKDFIDKKATIEMGSVVSDVKFVAKGNGAAAKIVAKNGIQNLKVTSDNKILIDLKNVSSLTESAILEGDVLVKTTIENNEGRDNIVVKKCYSSATEGLVNVSRSYYKDANIYVMISSHQDIGWLDSPYKCIEDRDKIIISPALELLQKHDDYRYDIEDVLMLEEYLTRNPSKRPLIEKLIESGRLGIGSSYTQPYEEMQSGESLVRQFYFGKRWVDKNFKGSNARTYWNVDVPGRTLQMPQIMKKSGVPYVQYSRHERSIFDWYSPDSSFVTAFTPGHYAVASTFLRKTPEEGLPKFIEYVESFDDYRSDKSAPVVMGMLSAEDMSPAHTYYHWIDKFISYKDAFKAPLPKLQHSTSDMFFDAFLATKPVLDRVVGERPNLWLYIHGPTHERALTTFREANRVAISAESFSTIASLLKGSFNEYPKSELDEIWKDIIYADHGWGGNKGHVTDSLFNARYENALKVATRVNREALDFIASSVKTNPKMGTPLVVFNQLSYVCSSPVVFELDTKHFSLENLTLKNSDGESVPYQVVKQENERVEIEFIANDMPSVGYKTYYMTFKTAAKKSVDKSSVESNYYKLTLNDGKLTQVFDKELNKELFDCSKFEVAEIFTMQSVGNGAGEFATMQLPTMENFDKTSSHGAKWSVVANGDVFALYKSVVKFKDAEIVRYMKLYRDIKRIDFPVEINGFNGNKYREFRQAFPLKSKAEVSYEVPFGTVTVGKDEIKGAAGERYMDISSEIHPRGIANWFGGKDNEVDVKLTSSVVVVDYIDPTDDPVSNTILQPILLASRRSCHAQGEFYLQHGDHDYNFSLRSDAVDDKMGDLKSVASNYMPTVIISPSSYKNAVLPETNSFFSVNAQNVVISAIKKCEDDNSVVVRVYDALSGGEQNVKINTIFPIKSVESVDMIELNPKPLFGGIKVGNRAIETVKLRLL